MTFRFPDFTLSISGLLQAVGYCRKPTELTLKISLFSLSPHMKELALKTIRDTWGCNSSAAKKHCIRLRVTKSKEIIIVTFGDVKSDISNHWLAERFASIQLGVLRTNWETSCRESGN